MQKQQLRPSRLNQDIRHGLKEVAEDLFSGCGVLKTFSLQDPHNSLLEVSI